MEDSFSLSPNVPSCLFFFSPNDATPYTALPKPINLSPLSLKPPDIPLPKKRTAFKPAARPAITGKTLSLFPHFTYG